MIELTKTEIDRILKIPGSVRGVALKTDAEFVVKDEGKEGLKKLTEELEKISCPIDYNEINSMDFYPVGLKIISLLAIKNVFGFDDEKIREMGDFAPKISLIIKFFMQYFLSLERTVAELPTMWKKHYTVGKLLPGTLDKKRKTLNIIVDVDFDPIYCLYWEGYFSKVLEMIVGSKVSCREIKCRFRGDNSHEFLLKW